MSVARMDGWGISAFRIDLVLVSSASSLVACSVMMAISGMSVIRSVVLIVSMVLARKMMAVAFRAMLLVSMVIAVIKEMFRIQVCKILFLIAYISKYFFWLHSLLFQPFHWIRIFFHYSMNKIQNYFFTTIKLAALWGLTHWRHTRN